VSRAFLIGTGRESRIEDLDRLIDLELVQESVGGVVKAVTLQPMFGLLGPDEPPRVAIMWVNRDGHRRNLPPNFVATSIARMLWTVYPDEMVVGAVLITGGATDEGVLLDAPDWVSSALTG